MKAKDIKWCPQHGYPLPCYKCGMPLTKTDQKEIYKAGIKLVIDYIRKQCLVKPDKDSTSRFESYYMVEVRMLKSFLKEHGIEKE